MSKTDQIKLNATPLVQSVEFLEGTSTKTGNKYLVGALYLRSPISDTPIRVGFDYLDPNTQALIKMAMEKFAGDQTADFKKGFED